MTRHDFRFIYSDNSVLADQTIALGNFRLDSFVMPHVSAEDYLYVGASWAFNNLAFDLSVVNDQPGAISVELWDGNDWQAAVSVLDYSAVSGVPLARNGHVTWDRDVDHAWVQETEAKDVDGLASAPVIREFYWARIKWSADLNVLTELNYIGPKFCTHDEVISFYPELNNTKMLERWDNSVSKVDWDEQIYMASDVLLRDLKKNSVIDFDGQVLDFALFKDAAIHKTAQIVYGGLGRTREEEFAKAHGMYNEALNVKQPRVDKDGDARLTTAETVHNTGFMTR